MATEDWEVALLGPEVERQVFVQRLTSEEDFVASTFTRPRGGLARAEGALWKK